MESSQTSSSLKRPVPIWKSEQQKDCQDPVFFWKPEDKFGYFCQWYPVAMRNDEGLEFNCCEQYMMYHKAKTFGDKNTMAAILKERNPRKQKSLGQRAKGFDEATWDKVKYGIVVQGNLLKFRQCKALEHDKFVYPYHGREPDTDEAVTLRHLLLSTGDRELVEASRFDRVWGIGFDAAHASEVKRSSWGTNLLGKALMEVRSTIRREAEDQDAGSI